MSAAIDRERPKMPRPPNRNRTAKPRRLTAQEERYIRDGPFVEGDLGPDAEFQPEPVVPVPTPGTPALALAHELEADAGDVAFVLQAPSLEERAQHIRDLVGTARHCIIEIGRELIAAKQVVGHGNWRDWVSTQFGWSERSAVRYMAVAHAFESANLADLSNLHIAAGAFSLLSHSEVSQNLRDRAMREARETGSLSTARAQEIINDAARDLLEQELAEASVRISRMGATILKQKDVIAHLEHQVQSATTAADLLVWVKHLAEFALDQPTDEQIERFVKKPSKYWVICLAGMIGRPIEYRGVRYLPPANKWELERLRRIEEAHRAKARELADPSGGLHRWYRVYAALQTLNELDDPALLFAERRSSDFDAKIELELDRASAWLADFTARFKGQ